MYTLFLCFQYFFAWSFSLTCHGIIVELKGYCACRLSLTVSFCQLSKWNTNLLLELATDKSKLVVTQCKGSRNQGSFLLGESRIQNPGNFVRWIRNPRLWNPEYNSSNATPTKGWESEIHVPQTKLRKQVPWIRNPTRGIQNPRLPWIHFIGRW